MRVPNGSYFRSKHGVWGKINSCGNEHQEITWNCKQRDVCFRITPGLFHKKALRRSCATGSWDTKRETDHRCARCFLVPPDKSAGFVGSEAPLARHQTLRCSAPRMPGCPVCAAGDVTVELYGHTVTRENFIDEIEEQCCFRTESIPSHGCRCCLGGREHSRQMEDSEPQGRLG